MAIKHSGLGRGLSSLIPNSRKPVTDFVVDPKLHEVMTESERISNLPVENIVANPNQPRRVFDQEALEGLAESIKEHGIIQPIIVSKIGPDQYELIAGERRLRASKLAGIITIPSIIREFSVQKKIELALIENLQREDLNPLEVALVYQKLQDEFNLSPDELSKKVGRSIPSIKNFIRLLNLRDEVKEAIMDGRLSEGHARSLAGLPYDDQLEGMHKIIDGKFTVRDAEKLARDVVIKKHIRAVRHDPEAQAMEDYLASTLGTKVQVRRRAGIGEITIKFFSNEELKRIIDKIR